MTLNDLVLAINPLEKLSKCTFENTRKSYRVNKFISAFNNEIKFFQNERYNLAKKYGVCTNEEEATTEESKIYMVMPNTPENVKFQNDFLDLLSMEINVDFSNSDISIDDIIDAETSEKDNRLTPTDLKHIENLIFQIK